MCIIEQKNSYSRPKMEIKNKRIKTKTVAKKFSSKAYPDDRSNNNRRKICLPVTSTVSGLKMHVISVCCKAKAVKEDKKKDTYNAVYQMLQSSTHIAQLLSHEKVLPVLIYLRNIMKKFSFKNTTFIYLNPFFFYQFVLH